MRGCIFKAGAAVTLCSVAGGTAFAADWDFSGFIRQEIAVKTTDDFNITNDKTNAMNGVTVRNNSVLTQGAVPTLTRPGSKTEKNDFNLFMTRVEMNLNGKLTEDWSAHFKLRAISDQIGQVDNTFHGVNLHQQPFYGGKRGTLLEAAGKDWMMDLPAAYLDYTNGPLWLRMGNQQIAWGEAIFFRVSDVVNGLDLRRHSVLGPAAEEYSDSRLPALGLRGSYRVNPDWDIEGFAQRFTPTLLPPPNSPYNPIAAQFTIHEKEGYDKVKDNWNFGFRLRGKVGNISMHGFAVRRNNPDGVFKWTLADGKGALPGSAFEGGTTSGVYSAAEWFKYASLSRLDGLSGLTTALNEFPGTQALGANAVASACSAPSSGAGAVSVNNASAACILDTFFSGGNLRGHLVREFPRESIFGFGLNTVFEGEPDSFTDQLIGRFEMSYTPNKRFTAPSLTANFIDKDETTFAFIFEKYHKFSQAFPATYIVAQWMHKTASDIFGRSLKGYKNVEGQSPQGLNGGFNAVALALQQPSPTLEWRYDFTMLTDLKGGWLFQPGAKWKPNKDMQLDIYANVIKSYGTQDYRNFAQGAEHANEIFLRGTYSF